MKYIEIITGDTVWIHKIRTMFPEKSIPDNADLTELGYKRIELTEPPIQEGFYAVEIEPVDYVQTWELRPVETIVPEIITPLQAKLQLLEMELFDEVETLLANNTKYRIYWENAQTIERNSVILTEIAGLLKLTPTGIDDMFIAASKIVA